MIKPGCVWALVLLFSLVIYGQGPPKPAPPLLIELGRSVVGRPINAIVYGSGKKRVLVLGAIHGDEGATAAVVRAFANSLALEPASDSFTVIIVSEVNPDGLASGTRVNANGVDINRNFPAQSWRPAYRDGKHNPGKQPATEPETRAIIELLKRYPPDLVFAFHAALGCVNWDGPADEVAKITAGASGFSLCPYLGYETPGSLGQYAGRDQNIPVVSIELADDNDSPMLWTRTLHEVLSRISVCSHTTTRRSSGSSAKSFRAA